MQLSADAELIIRTWVGDEPLTTDLEALYDVVLSWDAVVEATIRRKIALLSEDPSSISVPGLSVSNGQQIQTLQALLKEFKNSDGTGLDAEALGGIGIGRIVRVGNGR